MAHPTMEQVRGVNWGSTSKWDILIPDAPPLKANNGGTIDFFPATDVSFDSVSLESFSTEYGSIEVSVPKTIKLPDLKVTFDDDINNTLFEWFTKWIDYIYNNADGIRTLNEPGVVRTVILMTTDHRRNPIKTKKLRVYPDSGLSEELNSTASAKSYTINFKVVGAMED